MAARKESIWVRLRNRPGIDHLIRAGDGYITRNGDHYAAAITYFSVLSLLPMVMIAFAGAGFILAGNQDLLAEIQKSITEASPPAFADFVNDLIEQAIEARTSVGVVGLLIAAYSGLGWMTSLRDALSAMWQQAIPDRPFLRNLLSDLLSLISLGLALLISLAITTAGTALGDVVLRWLGLDDDGWAMFLLLLATIALSLITNWLLFLWILTRFPRQRVSARAAMRGAVFAAVGFEVLKQGATLIFTLVKDSPTLAFFGQIIALLLFANLVSRLLLFVAAWTATAKESIAELPVPGPEPVVIRPVVEVQRRPRFRDGAALLGTGMVLGALWDRRRRR
ncbi:MAG TPA: inner membrane protein YhjD [Actinophytocola sp.]|uniref:inner membrane protein YhjD n=1 Tax=Actinophytocola sp. TaxID=1872138 RepID=UPI002DBBC603|nr:inner membrane protein YhjD [Actinophytocola sp.]HEU5473908.1 inner membrane protein YhjD [Actinophytocola sp.]